MRRCLALAFLLAACGGASKHEPAWPKSAGTVPAETWQEDGGQSIEPREPTDVAAAESVDDPLIDFGDLTIDIAPDPVPTAASDVPPDPPINFDITPDDTITIDGNAPPPPSSDSH